MALLATQFLFAVNFSAVKFLFNNHFTKPFGLNLVRIIVTTALLWLLFFASKNKERVEPKDYGRMAICALAGIALNQLLFIKGLSYTSSIHAALLMLTTPIIIVFIAAWLLKEKLTAAKIFGLCFGIAGSVILILSKQNSALAPNPMLGDALIIINAISYAFYFILVKPLMLKYSPITIIRSVFTIGFFMALPFCFNEFVSIPWKSFTSNAWFAMFSVVIMGTFFTYLFTAYGIKVLGASTAGAYIYAQPVFAAAIAWIILSEEITWVKIVSGLMIAMGLYITNNKKLNRL